MRTCEDDDRRVSVGNTVRTASREHTALSPVVRFASIADLTETGVKTATHVGEWLLVLFQGRKSVMTVETTVLIFQNSS